MGITRLKLTSIPPPPPPLEAAADVRTALDALAELNGSVFDRLFLLERQVNLPQSLADHLVAANMIQPAHRGFKALVRVWRQHRMYFASDQVTASFFDRVYPAYLDQAGFFSERLKVKPEDQVLDIGTGSGILAIVAATISQSVLGIDVNPRAIAFAQFNAAINRLSHRAKFSLSSFEDCFPSPFTLITCNPPFTAVPDQDSWYRHGSAGMDGHKIFRAILRNLPRLLQQECGTAQFLINSPGDAANIQALELIKEISPKSKLTVHHLFEPRAIPISRYTTRFINSPYYQNWKEWLKQKHFTHLYRMVVTIEQAGPPEIIEHRSPGYLIHILEPFGKRPIAPRSPYWSGGWREMLLRYGSRHKLYNT